MTKKCQNRDDSQILQKHTYSRHYCKKHNSEHADLRGARMHNLKRSSGAS